LYAQTVHEVEVTGQPDRFIPDLLTIQAGDTVRWVNAAGGNQHDVVSEDDAWTPSVLANEFIFEVTFDDPGSFDYFCTPHRAFGMTGTITVQGVEEQAFLINAAMSDAWFFPDTAGQGFFIIVWEDQKLIFLAWFTYDTERPPEDVMANLGEPGHRWLTALGPYDGDSALLDVFLSSGMIFDSGTPEVTTEQLEDATIWITWSSCEEGVLTYNIPSLELSGDIPIQRIVDDNVAACEAAQAP
jgi:plastocyanin